MRTLAVSHGVHLLPLPASLHGVQVLADRTRPRQVLLELLCNAVTAAGFDGYLTKPPDLDLLLGTVRRAL